MTTREHSPGCDCEQCWLENTRPDPSWDALAAAARECRGRMIHYHGTPETFPCGHPRTSENTRLVGRAGVRCKQCRKVIDQAFRDRVKARAA